MAKITKAAIATALALVITESNGSLGYALIEKPVADELVKAGQAEINPNISDGTKVATRATAAVLAAAAAASAASGAVAPATAAAKPKFEIESGIEVPAISGRGRAIGSSVYPFDQLQVGQSFFVPKEPRKLGSTVSSANARFSEEVPGQTRTNRNGKTVPVTKQTRVFVARAAEKDGVSGSRVWRTV